MDNVQQWVTFDWLPAWLTFDWLSWEWVFGNLFLVAMCGIVLLALCAIFVAIIARIARHFRSRQTADEGEWEEDVESEDDSPWSPLQER